MGNGHPVVVIEDDSPILGLVTDVLRDEGYVAASATSPAEADALLATLGRTGIGLVLSDSFRQGQADPYAWFERVRARTAAPVVIWSANDPAMYADWRERGYAAVLAKPFDLDELVALVAALYPAASSR